MRSGPSRSEAIATWRKVLLLSLFATAPQAAAQSKSLPLERITSLPRLTGTSPTSPLWSPDGKRIAFLWNDRAMPFRDIWVASVDGDALRRVTDMAREFPPPVTTDLPSDERLALEAAARHHPGISEAIWTPDGRGFVFAFRTAYDLAPRVVPRGPTPSGVDDLFRIGADGAGLTRLTAPAGDKYALGFSPDGKYLSFLQEGDLRLWNQETNELVPATRLAQPAIGQSPLNTCCGPGHSRPDVEVITYLWSPDGRFIALQVDDRSRVRKVLLPDYLGVETRAEPNRRDYPGDNDHARDLVLYSVGEGRLKRIGLPDTTDRSIASLAWSPDSRHLLVDQFPQSAVHRWIFVVNREEGSIREVWHDERPTRTTQNWTSTWSSAGDGIVFLSDIDGRHRLYSLKLGEKTPQLLTPGNWSVIGESGPPRVWVSRSRKEIFFVSNQKSPYERQVYRLPEAGGTITQVTSMPGVHHPFASPDGTQLALLHSNDLTPTELYLVSTEGGAQERRLTRSPAKDFADYAWVEPRYVIFPSHVDGTTLHGRLLEPRGLDRSKKYPVILGPVYSNSVRNRWGDRDEWRGLYSSLQQHLVLEGQYVVFQVDVRGSVGYGREFRDKLRRDYGGIDVEDLESGVRYLKTLPYVDPGRFGIWGSSYGGLMTAMSLFKKPGLYKAGVASAPATNVWHAMTGQVNVAGRPEANPETYRKVSAVSYGENLQDHLMIIHGMQDSIVLFKDSVTLAEKLMLLGKDFDLVVAPSAVHEWGAKDYVGAYLLRKLVSHFDRYLDRGPR